MGMTITKNILENIIDMTMRGHINEGENDATSTFFEDLDDIINGAFSNGETNPLSDESDTYWKEFEYYLDGIKRQFEFMDEHYSFDEESISDMDTAVTKLYENWNSFKNSLNQ